MLLLPGISFLPHVYLFTGPEIEASTKGRSGEIANQSGHSPCVGRDWSKYLIRGPCIEFLSVEFRCPSFVRSVPVSVTSQKL